MVRFPQLWLRAHRTLGIGIFCLLLAPPPSGADIVFYRLPTQSGAVVTLEGTTTVNPGGSVTYHHSRFGRIYLDLASTDIRKAPSIASQFNRQLGRAGKDPEKLMEAAQWALRRGLLTDFYSTIDKVLEIHPQHPRAGLVKQLKQQMQQTLPDAPQQEKQLKEFVGRPEMKIKRSKHFRCSMTRPKRPPAASSRGPTSACSSSSRSMSASCCGSSHMVWSWKFPRSG